jgi:hypothetical protein
MDNVHNCNRYMDENFPLYFTAMWSKNKVKRATLMKAQE